MARATSQLVSCATLEEPGLEAAARGGTTTRSVRPSAGSCSGRLASDVSSMLTNTDCLLRDTGLAHTWLTPGSLRYHLCFYSVLVSRSGRSVVVYRTLARGRGRLSVS